MSRATTLASLLLDIICNRRAVYSTMSCSPPPQSRGDVGASSILLSSVGSDCGLDCGMLVSRDGLSISGDSFCGFAKD